jgi:hypothetical protein
MDLNNFLHVACNYHYLGWVLTWKYLKQGFWGEILILVEKSPILRIVSYLVNMDRFEYFFACGL